MKKTVRKRSRRAAAQKSDPAQLEVRLGAEYRVELPAWEDEEYEKPVSMKIVRTPGVPAPRVLLVRFER